MAKPNVHFTSRQAYLEFEATTSTATIHLQYASHRPLEFRLVLKDSRTQTHTANFFIWKFSH